ncbi:hypothetical protein [Nostoc sp.]
MALDLGAHVMMRLQQYLTALGSYLNMPDADISKCFDQINHEALLRKIGTFPKPDVLLKHGSSRG